MSNLKQARLLIAEDEKNVGQTLVDRLSRDGFDVTWVQTAADAEEQIARLRFDLVVLDIGLPDGSGFKVAETLRAKQPGAALVFLTAFGNPEERVRGLELGAEDYIVKPFHLKELLLRIQNALKRARYLQDAGDNVRLGEATVHFSRYQAEVRGKMIGLTHKECSLLKLLCERRGAVVSRDEILNHVWSQEDFPTPRTVDNFILRLRKLVEADPENPRVIRSVRGVGYQLELEKGLEK